jgi:hypothetical protein
MKCTPACKLTNLSVAWHIFGQSSHSIPYFERRSMFFHNVNEISELTESVMPKIACFPQVKHFTLFQTQI